MMPIFRAASAAAALMWFQSAAADPALNDLAARTELHAFESLTLTDQQFLTGDKGGEIVHGVGMDANIVMASLKAVLSAVLRLLAREGRGV